MRHAVLIIAHKNVEQVIRLIHSLQDESLDIYIHIDKKWAVSPSDLQKIADAGRYVVVLEERFSGFLDTWSLCEITLALMKCALSCGDYGYYMLLSAQDYPIKPISYIKAYLDEQYPKPLIDCTPMVKDNWIYSGFRWIRFHAYYRLVERITKSVRLRKLLLLPAYALQLVVTMLVGSPYKRLKKEGCMLYGGSAWWILPHEIVKLCVEEVDKKTEIVKAFKLKNTPEETFFQTMAMRSRLKDMIEVNNPHEVLQNCMTYAYFFDETHAPTGHPYILNKNNFEMIKKRKELFARKFDIDVDAEILTMIDLQILKEEL